MADSSPLAANKPALDYDLESCSHRHEILAAAVEDDEGRPTSVTLYHWCPPTVRKITTVIMSSRLLPVIKGFTPLGTFFLPDELDISQTFSDLLTTTTPTPQPTSQLLADVIALLPPPKTGTFLQFSSFPVFGNSPDNVSSHDLLPVWKWIKPESPYRKTGFWEAELDKVLDDGEWNGGKELVLLVRGVSKETLQNVTAEGRKIINFELFAAE